MPTIVPKIAVEVKPDARGDPVFRIIWARS